MIQVWKAVAAMVPVLSAGLQAQTIRGTVTDDRAAPVAGVIMLLLDSRDSVVARTLSNERGEYRLSARSDGTYRVRTQRIGFRPVISPAYELRAGTDVAQRLALTGLPVSLRTVSITGTNVCRGLGDSTAATFLVWEQVRAGLTATELSMSARGTSATSFAYERVLDAAGSGVLEQNSSVRITHGSPPWRSLSPEMIHRAGYVVPDGTGSLIYHAPGLEVLTSDFFLEDHCFRIASSSDAARVGIAFEPTPARSRIPELRGTLWVDRSTSELESLEFRYANLPRERATHAGGAMQFARMSDGAWVITGWEIRMPVLAQQSSLRMGRRGGTGVGEIRVVGVKVTGGKVLVSRRGRDTLWMRPPLVLTGSVVDSATAAPIPRARISLAGTTHSTDSDATGRFAIPGVIPGGYTVVVRTASLDSLGVAHQASGAFIEAGDSIRIRVPTARQVAPTLCRSDERPTGVPSGASLGILAGRVAGVRDSTSLAAVRIVAEWAAPRSDGATGGEETAPTYWFETRPNAEGFFLMCSLPVNTALVVQADGAGRRSPPVRLAIPTGMPFLVVALPLDSAIDRSAVFTGLVVDDSVRRPIANAEVALPGLARSTLTNAQGAFRFADIPAGSHRVVVRRVGYRPLDTPVTFVPNATVERRVVLAALTTLEDVTVRADRADIPDIDASRRAGLGQFLTRADLEKQGGRTLSDIIAQTPGVRLVRGRANRVWVSTNRGQGSLQNLPIIDTMDQRNGAKPNICYAQIYLDQMLVYAGRDGEPLFDINTVVTDQIEAIEFYAGASQTPLRYSGLDSACGALVIHTRRDMHRSDAPGATLDVFERASEERGRR